VRTILSSSDFSYESQDNTVTEETYVYDCDSCKDPIDNGVRFRCNHCDNLDLCWECYKGGKYPSRHKPEHFMSMFQEPGNEPLSTVTYHCNNCKSGIAGSRFHCNSCHDFDLCQSCYKSGNFPSPHETWHGITLFREPGRVKLTMEYNCDTCGMSPIIGQRFRCKICNDFDQCDSCHTQRKTCKSHKNYHEMAIFLEPGSIEYDPTRIEEIPQVYFTALDKDSPERQRIEKYFKSCWQKLTQNGLEILHVLEVQNSKLSKDFEEYYLELQSRNQDPNDQERWHGTKRKCKLYETLELCSDTTCALCSIVTHGFDQKRAQSNISFGRFGKGIYFAPHSCKSHAYTQAMNGIRVMLLCKICLGNTYVTRKNMQHITIAPPGYDSVSGDTGKGSVLNWPEIVIYNNRAVLPINVIFYKSPAKH